MSQKSLQDPSYFQSLQRRGYSIYSISIFLLFYCLAVGLILISDYRKFEQDFSSDVEKIHREFDFNIKQNEAVLEGLSSFVAGVGGVNEKMLNRYAEQIKERFPHIFMLEVAAEVNKSNLKSFIQEKKKQGYPKFDIKAFDYSGNRKWRKLPDKEKYFPLVYLYPLPEESEKVLGLDLGSHEHLSVGVKKSLEGGYQTSLPFNLIEGDKAFVMFKAVKLGDGDSSSNFISVLVVTAHDFRFNVDLDEANESIGVLIYHNSKNENDRTGHFVFNDIEKNPFLPQFTFTSILAPEQTGFILKIIKQFQFSDISWILLLVVLHLLLSVFFIRRSLFLKSKSIQDKLLKASQQKYKMAAISNLTGGIAHEFNNNLSVIRGFLSLLSEKIKSDNESKSWLKHAEAATEKSIELTQKLLTYSRYKGIRERVSNIHVNEHIIAMEDELLGLLNKDIDLKVNLAENLRTVLFGEDDLKEILFELVHNANDSIEGKGLITISTEKFHLNNPKDIDIENDVDIVLGDYIHLKVSDTGSGISDDIKLHVFDPFFTTKEFGESSGMGLASVYGLVKLNNGYISFISGKGKGTSFNVYIPVLK